MARPTGVGRAITTCSMPIEGRDEWLAAARRLADEASARWPASPPLPLRWLDTWPAMAADAELGDPGRAIGRSGVLLDPGQWPPAASVAEGLRALVEADGPETQLLLARVLDLAHEAGYL